MIREYYVGAGYSVDHRFSVRLHNEHCNLYVSPLIDDGGVAIIWAEVTGRPIYLGRIAPDGKTHFAAALERDHGHDCARDFFPDIFAATIPHGNYLPEIRDRIEALWAEAQKAGRSHFARELELVEYIKSINP